MSIFSRVKTEDVKDLSDLCKMRGIEHAVLPLAGDFSDWSTFQFTTDNAKSSFDSYAREEGFILQQDQVSNVMLDAVTSGADPRDLLDEALTNGLKNAMRKNSSGRHCPECDFEIPKYNGRYPAKCPECGSTIVLKDSE